MRPAFTGSGEQHPLLISMPMKSKLKAFIFEDVVLKAANKQMTEGANAVGTLHFAHFVPLADTHLGFFTIYDGTFEKYMQDFTEKIGPVFDLMFKYVSDPPPTPVAKNAEATDLPPSGITVPIRAWRSRTSEPCSPTREQKLLSVERPSDNASSICGTHRKISMDLRCVAYPVNQSNLEMNLSAVILGRKQ